MHPQNLRAPHIDLAHGLIAPYLGAGAIVLDGTAGNGHDLEFIARSLGPGGFIWAFDRQASAIEASRARLVSTQLETPIAWVQDSHAELASYLGSSVIDAAIFNLGYLPGHDKSITTQADSTITALQAVIERLRGGLAVVCYRGHAGGAAETEAVMAWARALDSKLWLSSLWEPLNRPSSPVLVGLRRLPQAKP